MTSSAPSVAVDALTVVRGGRTVLDQVTLEVPAGQVTGLLGPSGGGKTTLMRSIVGVQIIESGRVEVMGRTAGDPQLRHRIGYVTQDPAVYPDLSTRENLRYFAAVLGAALRDVERVLREVDLVDSADRPVASLSGGQAARASLAVALLGQPDLLVLDEPTVGLDPVLRAELWGHFRRLAATGVTVLVSSHVMDEAVRCDRLLLLREGRLIADSTVPELLVSTGAADVEEAFLRLVGAAPEPGQDR